MQSQKSATTMQLSLELCNEKMVWLDYGLPKE
jgi:hypothetical protein